MIKGYFGQLILLMVLVSLIGCSGSAVQSRQDHDSHLMTINQQGDRAMGFSHEKTTHHFRLYPDGGAIEVTANSPEDTESRDQIRRHLRHISQMFAEGNFDAPMLTHGKVPPGVPIMQKLKAEISYTFEELENGGRVRIKTKNEQVLAAVAEFLRFQISDHQTGDSNEVVNE